MSNSWFRMYQDSLNNIKVQSLDGDTFKSWVNILCVTSQRDGRHVTRDELEFYLRMSQERINVTVDLLIEKNLLIETEDGIIPYAWDEYQYKSDSSAERTRKYRAAKKKQQEEAKKNKPLKRDGDGECDVTCDKTVTPPDTDTDTDTDTENINNKKNNIKKNKSQIPEKPKLDYSCWPSIPSQQLFDDWKQVRKSHRAKITQTVINQFGRELQKAVDSGVTVDQCFEKIISRNWRGFEFAWMQNTEHVKSTVFAVHPAAERKPRNLREVMEEQDAQYRREIAEEKAARERERQLLASAPESSSGVTQLSFNA